MGIVGRAKSDDFLGKFLEFPLHRFLLLEVLGLLFALPLQTALMFELLGLTSGCDHAQ